ncbi:putative bifunctional diguanylate cyclase/phosphodiesterase [Roseobacter sp. EG26]|uniref:putative bifunctional diguanylate cyclase/phosphodiesterase n=1 Tax=Roseobacter sp. EG26 TaxID=3412477 RepID=UPI003CE5C350
MPGLAKKKHSRHRPILDALSSRVGFFMSIGFLMVLGVGAGLYTQSVVTQLGKTHAIFEDRQIRNGYVAISDIQRLLLVTQRAINASEMTPELDLAFRDATDIVYVRTDHLRHILNKDRAFETGTASVESLEKIVALADDAIASNYANLDGFFDELLIASEDARRILVLMLDDMRRHGDEVMSTQNRVVKKQQVIVLGSLIGLTIVGGIALLFLHLEVLGRRAREKAEKRVEFLAFFDPLTELPNRVQFQERLQRLLENEHSPVALLYIDLDEFKTVNDTFGHAAGDAVLKRIGQVLTEAAGEYGGFAARLGGDEFAMVALTDDMKALDTLCEHLILRAAAPLTFEGETLEVSVSIGLATTTQVKGRMSASIDGMSRVTDFALYASKANGRNCYTVYDLELEKRFLDRRAMLEELPKAISAGDLEVHLQPKVSLPKGKTYGFEALVRWRRNGRLVSPAEFILLAEESGLVIGIDNFVLNHAAKLIADWNEQHGTELAVSVNLSALHFNSQKIIQTVEHALWKSDLRPDLLTLEITESTEMRDWEQAKSIILGLKKLGCKIAIDDFGTGFSSLAYLRAMVADELKVDRSLVEELETSQKARLMLASVFEIAKNLELEIVVEGIENQAQAQIVFGLGARRAQGFFYGRPDLPERALTHALSVPAEAEPKAAS